MKVRDRDTVGVIVPAPVVGRPVPDHFAHRIVVSVEQLTRDLAEARKQRDEAVGLLANILKGCNRRFLACLGPTKCEACAAEDKARELVDRLDRLDTDKAKTGG